jgi:hypothetical protein
VEAAYLELMRHGVGETPPLFVSQLVHVILRNVLDRCEDVFVLRAAELLFRPQRLTVHGGSLIAADEETVAGVRPQVVSPLVAMLGLPAAGEIDVLNDDNAETYWERSDVFDMALDLTAGRRGLDALGQVIERWIAHLLPVEVEVEALTEATGVNPGMSVSTPRRPRSAIRCGTAKSSTRPRASASSASTGSPSATRDRAGSRQGNPSICY